MWSTQGNTKTRVLENVNRLIGSLLPEHILQIHGARKSKQTIQHTY